MKSFKFFMEMPLNKYSVAPFSVQTPQSQNLSEPTGHFNARDRKAITNENIRKKIESVLNKNKYNWNIIFLEDNFSFDRSRSSYLKGVVEYCKKNNIPLEGHITFTKNSSTGEPLTPWMILHNIGHGLFEEEDVTKTQGKIYALLSQLHSEPHYLPNIADKFKFASAQASAQQLYSNEKPNKLAVKSQDEFVYEMLAEYLWHGHIRLNDNQEPNDQKIIKEIENAFDQMLSGFVGRIITDHFGVF